MTSGPQPGFLELCGSTGTPVDFSTAAARDRLVSRERAPAVLETIRSRLPG